MIDTSVLYIVLLFAFLLLLLLPSMTAIQSVLLWPRPPKTVATPTLSLSTVFSTTKSYFRCEVWWRFVTNTLLAPSPFSLNTRDVIKLSSELLPHIVSLLYHPWGVKIEDSRASGVVMTDTSVGVVTTIREGVAEEIRVGVVTATTKKQNIMWLGRLPSPCPWPSHSQLPPASEPTYPMFGFPYTIRVSEISHGLQIMFCFSI